MYTPVSLISTFGYINFHLYQHLFWLRFSPMSHNLDSVISRFIYIIVNYRNRQVDISETEVYTDHCVEKFKLWSTHTDRAFRGICPETKKYKNVSIRTNSAIREEKILCTEWENDFQIIISGESKIPRK